MSSCPRKRTSLPDPLAAAIGGLYLVADGTRRRHFRDLGREAGMLGRPIAERTAEAVCGQIVAALSFKGGLFPETFRKVAAEADQELAEGAGFEPAIEFPAYTLSRRAPSTTRPPLRNARGRAWGTVAEGSGACNEGRWLVRILVPPAARQA